MNAEIVNMLVEELERRRQLNIYRYHLRDTSNPFELPEEFFRQSFRLNIKTARDLLEKMLPFLNNVNSRRTRAPPIVRFFSALSFLVSTRICSSYNKCMCDTT